MRYSRRSEGQVRVLQEHKEDKECWRTENTADMENSRTCDTGGQGIHGDKG